MNYHRLKIPNSYIFLTIVTSKRRPILIDNIKLLKTSVSRAIFNFNFKIVAICVLPDHAHMIINPYEIKDYPNIVRQIKTYFSKHIDTSKIDGYELTQSNINKQEFDIWQRRYWEHTITTQEDLYRHIDYIHYNPYKHGYVEKISEWKFSSFHQFVEKGYYDKNWCNFEDKYQISNLDFE